MNEYTRRKLYCSRLLIRNLVRELKEAEKTNNDELIFNWLKRWESQLDFMDVEIGELLNSIPK